MAGLKPRVAFADLAWMSAFEKVKQLGEGATVGDYKIVWIYDDPPITWLQVKIGKVKKIIRKGAAGIFDLIAVR